MKTAGAWAVGVVLASAVGCAAPETVEPSGSTGDAIVNGTATNERPGIGLLLDVTDAPNSFDVCTGTVIGKRTVLTASHCVDRPGQMSRFIIHDASGKPSAVAQVLAGDAGRFRAPGYVTLPKTGATLAQFLANPDIAIVKIDRDLPVTPIAVAVDAPVAGTFFTLVGYGATGPEAGNAGTVRQQTTNYIQDISPLHIAFKGAGPFGIVCGGDSGGPLLVRDNATGAEAVAAVAHFSDCATASGETRTDVFKEWIQRVSGGDVTFASDTGLPNLP